MKSCPYCGKEYPDDATVCSIDQQRLDSETRTESSRPKKLIDMAARPATVKFAVGLLAFDMVFDLALMIFKYQSSGAGTHHFYLFIGYTFGILAVLLYLLFRGYNWVRWLMIAGIVFGIVAGPFVRIGPAHWNTYLANVICGMAVVALLQPPSNEWYRGTKTVVPAS